MSVIQTQWDLASSAFSISDRAMALMRAATRDDVQPAAVYAIEALGSMIITSPSLIGKAVDALGGNKSFRIDNLKLVIGLSSNGVASEIRKSTPALRCFLLISALKLHIKPGQISNLLYEMLEQSGLLNTTPVSDSQLAQLIHVISGNCNCLLDTESIPLRYITPLLNSIADSEKQHISSLVMSEIYENIPAKSSAKLLLSVFHAIQNENISLVKITGWRGALWYTSLIMWLNPNSVQVSLGNAIIFKASSERVEIHIILQPPMANYSTEWSVEEWSEVHALSSLLKIPSYDRFHSPDTFSPPHGQRWQYAQSRVPREMAYSLWQSVGGVTEEDLKLVTYVASGIVMSIIETTKFDAYVDRISTARGVSKRWTPDANPWLKHIFSHDFLLSPMTFIVSFGFPRSSTELYFTEEARNIRDFIIDLGPRDDLHAELGIVNIIMEYFKLGLDLQTTAIEAKHARILTYSHERATCVGWLESECHRRAMRICALAVHLASTCFLDAILSGDEPIRFLQLDNHFLRFGSEVSISVGEDPTSYTIYRDNDWTYKLNSNHGRWILDYLNPSSEPDICDFFNRSLMAFRVEDKSYPPISTKDVDDSIIISVDGIIVYPLCLLSRSSSQDEVMRLGMVNGNLEWKGTRFNNLRELNVDSAPSWTFERAIHWVNLEDRADLASVLSCKEQSHPSISRSTIVTSVGSDIISETWAYPEGSGGFIQSWKSSLLSWASVPKASQFDPRFDAELKDLIRPPFARIVNPVGPASRLAFSGKVDCEHLQDYEKYSVDGSKRLIAPMSLDPDLNFLRMSFISEGLVPCIVNDIEDLATCAVLAEHLFGKRWLIITL